MEKEHNIKKGGKKVAAEVQTTWYMTFKSTLELFWASLSSCLKMGQIISNNICHGYKDYRFYRYMDISSLDITSTQ